MPDHDEHMAGVLFFDNYGDLPVWQHDAAFGTRGALSCVLPRGDMIDGRRRDPRMNPADPRMNSPFEQGIADRVRA